MLDGAGTPYNSSRHIEPGTVTGQKSRPDQFQQNYL